MKRLFQINNKASGIQYREAGFFDNKKEAKESRDEINNGYGYQRVVVSPGPDHIGPHGHGSVPRMRRQPKNK